MLKGTLSWRSMSVKVEPLPLFTGHSRLMTGPTVRSDKLGGLII